jgi:hypothetical protein
VAELNKARVENPAFNKHEFINGSQLAALGNPAPLLDLDIVSTNSTVLKMKKRQLSNSTTTTNSTNASPYSLPTEVVEAARIVAESTAQVPTGDHENVAADIRRKYSHQQADTNRPPKLKTPEGLLSEFGGGIESNVSTLSKRAYGYWMADMPQLGASPYAPAGYKVTIIPATTPRWRTDRANKLRFRSGEMLRIMAPREMGSPMTRPPSISPSQIRADAAPTVVPVPESLPLSSFLRVPILSALRSFSTIILSS